MTNENKEGYKKTKVGLIPVEWEAVKIENIATLISGQHLNPNEYSLVKEGIPYFTGPTDFTNKINTVKKWTTNGKKKSLKGHVLITVKGSGVGSLFRLFLDEVAIGRQLMAIDSEDNSFIYYQLIINKNRFQNLASGNLIPGLSRKDILLTYIYYPPLPEQKKIAQILSIWDKAIEQTQALIQQLQQRKKGLMQQLLTGKTRLKGFEGEWKEVKLGDITTRVTTKNAELNDNVVTISAQRGFVRQEHFFKKRVASATLSGYFLIKRGDFCYNKSYSKGYPMGAFKRLDDLDKAVVTTLYICFSLKDNVDSDFMLNFFEGGQMIKNLMKIAQEGGRAHGLLNISLGDFFGLKLSIPDLSEQKAIAKILNASDEELEQQKYVLTTLQTQKKGLMQQLLTGQRRVVPD